MERPHANFARGLTDAGPLVTIGVANDMRKLTLYFLAMFSLTALAQEKVIRLYPGPAPGSEDWKQQERENRTNQWETRVVYNVAQPTLTVFQAEPAKANGTAVVICPGGAFVALSIDSEGFEVARALTAKGVTCFVLKYRLVQCKTDDPTRELWTLGDLGKVVAPIVRLAMADGQTAIGYVRPLRLNCGRNCSPGRSNCCPSIPWRRPSTTYSASGPSSMFSVPMAPSLSTIISRNGR